MPTVTLAAQDRRRGRHHPLPLRRRGLFAVRL